MRGQNRDRGRKSRRRGLASVVGAVFLIIVMVVALNAMVWTMQEHDRVSMAVTGEADTQLNRLNERIDITNVRVDSSKLNMTIANSGGQAAHLKAIYIVDETATPKQQYRYDLDSIVDSRKSLNNIGQTLPLTIDSDKNYSVKVISRSGSAVATNIGPAGDIGMGLSMYTIPPTIPPRSNVTILMSATYNNDDYFIAEPLSAKMTYSSNCVPTLKYPCEVVLQKAEGNGTRISSGSTALFKWVYTITAPDNTSFTFTGSLINGISGNSVSEKVTVKLLESNRSGRSGTTEFLLLKFLNTPGLSLITPGPFGTQSSDKAVWGVVVSNPTNQTLGVSRVSVSLASPPGSGGDNMIGAGCSITSVQPSTGTWSCPATNVMQWKAPAGTTVDVGEYESVAFIAAVPTDNIQSTEIPAVIITANAYTTHGQFSKVGYTTNMAKSGSVMANIYLSNGLGNSTAYPDIRGYMNDIPSGSTQTLHITLADFEDTASYKINSGARVVINLPPEWDVEDADIIGYGGFNTPVIVEFDDGSKQIKATRYSDITGAGGFKAGTISFNVHVPVIDEPRIYIITVTTDGEINTPPGFNLGATVDIPLQVNPPP